MTTTDRLAVIILSLLLVFACLFVAWWMAQVGLWYDMMEAMP